MSSIEELVIKAHKNDPKAMEAINKALDRKKVVKPKEEFVKKVAKDDSEVLKTKIKKLDFVEPKAMAKDDMDLLSMAKNLQSVNVEKMEGSEIYKHIGNLKKFLKSAMDKSEDDSLINPTKNIFQILDKIPKNIDLKKTEVPKNMVNQVLNAIKQINKSQKEV
ncbi:MAG: hypothetical protein LBJ32_02150 [Oscillospiraceae bacterium]|jgi:hypothetical protein|nr:hypothetical protein [Oscillospiraceae bacterium]